MLVTDLIQNNDNQEEMPMLYSHYSEYMAKSMRAHRPGPDKGEFEYLKKYLDSNSQPFLELGCGYGRLLLPIIEAGYSITGIDSSPEMLQQCRATGVKRGIEPVIYEQFMQKLSLEEKYGLIFIDDCTFTLIIEDKDVEELFERVYFHLKPGGTFLFDFYGYDPDSDEASDSNIFAGTNTGWVKDEDGAIYVSKSIGSYDINSHIIKRLMIHDCYIEGKLVGSQAFEDPNRVHNLKEVVRVLRSKGFIDIRTGGHQSDTVSDCSENIFSIRCKKQAV